VLTASGVLLVTGASRGIGASVAKSAAALGYEVVVNYREREAEALDVVSAIRDSGRRAIAVRADVSDEGDIVSMFAEIDRRMGPLTALVNNAGIVPRESRVEDMDAGTLEALWRVNVTAAFICSREAVRRMSTKRGGRGGAIVNVSSLAGLRGGHARRTHYAASKAALNGFTLGFAREVAAEGIRVNAVCPGVTDTDIHLAYGGAERVARLGAQVPIGRAALPEDVAATVSFLLSEQATYMTGAVIEMSGGL
jgi:NAD(P)-dependent dehydrogenase (short-subunit alcohol dehydrogenase family)